MVSLSQAIESMETVLKAEATALTSGRLDHLSQIERAKRKAWANLQIVRHDKQVGNLAQIQSLATRNARLLLAAKEGIATANSMRDALLKGPEPLATYGSDGRKSTVVIERTSKNNSRSF
jgi:flagellar biosynthesis/type III secretory pathway chaperone